MGNMSITGLCQLLGTPPYIALHTLLTVLNLKHQRKKCMLCINNIIQSLSENAISINLLFNLNIYL